MAPFAVTSESTGQPCDTTDLPDPTFRCSFSAQTTFSALRLVDHLRGASCRRKEEPPVHDIWNIRAPDFAVKHYAPPIKKPPRANAQPIDDGNVANRRKKTKVFKSNRKAVHFNIMADQENEDQDLILRFRALTPNTDRRIAVRNGKHPRDPYLDPKPHDHRGLPPIKNLGLPELVTSSNPDPLNIHFKNKHLDILDLRQVQTERQQDVKPHWASRKTPSPQWLQSLTLRNEPYRKRFAAFTRHRRLDRTVYSSLMERIEDDFNKEWNNRP